MMLGSISRDETDYDSSCSSITVPESSRSWMSNLSFGACSSGDTQSQKPHKANQAAWEAMNRLRVRAEKGQVGLQHFRILGRLGSGDIGNVYLCQIRNDSEKLYYAMKVVDMEALAVRNKLQRAQMEIQVLAMLDHPFLPTLYAHFHASHYSCLVIDFCSAGDLHAARLRRPASRFTISSAKFYAAEILVALEYLHMMGVVYRDLKPENVLVREDGHIMLSDFDLSLKCDVIPMLLRSKSEPQTTDKKAKPSMPSCSIPILPVLSCFSKRNKITTITTTIIEEQIHIDHDHQYNQELVAEPTTVRSKSFVGTHEYLAPEVISGQGHGSAVDWWTLGVFLYELLYGITPFKGENNERTLVNILKHPLTFPRIGVSSRKEYEEMVKVEDLIRKLLVKNPKKRIGSLRGSVEIKRHEFFKGVNWALIRSVRPPHVPTQLERIRSRAALPKLSKKERDAPYQIPHHFDYF